jgi:hypothetical protein
VRQPTFPDVIHIVWRWARGSETDWRQRWAEERLVNLIAEQLADEPEPEIVTPAERKA